MRSKGQVFVFSSQDSKTRNRQPFPACQAYINWRKKKEKTGKKRTTKAKLASLNKMHRRTFPHVIEKLNSHGSCGRARYIFLSCHWRSRCVPNLLLITRDHRGWKLFKANQFISCRHLFIMQRVEAIIFLQYHHCYSKMYNNALFWWKTRSHYNQ